MTERIPTADSISTAPLRADKSTTPLRLHEAVCAERYANLLTMLEFHHAACRPVGGARGHRRGIRHLRYGRDNFYAGIEARHALKTPSHRHQPAAREAAFL